NFFVANIQTGFGPFIAVYLTTQGWTQTQIGLALSVGTLAAMASQLPAGALVDVIRSKAAVALFSILAFTASAVLLALWPTPLFVYLAQVLHGFSSCTLGPAIATMSLIIAGRQALGLRLGRNARFAAIGNGVGAALMGACGYYYSSRSVFFLTAALTIVGLVPLLPLARLYGPGRPAARHDAATARHRDPVASVLTNRALLSFAVCAMLFTLGNAAMLPLTGPLVTSDVAANSGRYNLALGFVGLMIGVGATFSTAVAGWIADAFGNPIAFMSLAAIGLAAATLVWMAMPETRPGDAGIQTISA